MNKKNKKQRQKRDNKRKYQTNIARVYAKMLVVFEQQLFLGIQIAKAKIACAVEPGAPKAFGRIRGRKIRVGDADALLDAQSDDYAVICLTIRFFIRADSFDPVRLARVRLVVEGEN